MSSDTEMKWWWISLLFGKKPAYTLALSRVRTLQGFHILNLCENKIHIGDNVKEEMRLLRTDLKVASSLQFSYFISDKCHKIVFLNVRSLHKHIDDVKSDFTLMACHVEMFCETRLMNYDTENTNSYHIQDYQNVLFEGHSARIIRSTYGLAFYTKYHI